MAKKKSLSLSSSTSFHFDRSQSPLYPPPQAQQSYPPSIPLSPLSFLASQQQQQQQQLHQKDNRPSLVKTVLNLTGCMMGVAGSIVFEVTSYWTRVLGN